MMPPLYYCGHPWDQYIIRKSDRYAHPIRIVWGGNNARIVVTYQVHLEGSMRRPCATVVHRDEHLIGAEEEDNGRSWYDSPASSHGAPTRPPDVPDPKRSLVPWLPSAHWPPRLKRRPRFALIKLHATS